MSVTLTAANGKVWLEIDDDGALKRADWDIISTLSDANKLGARDPGTLIAAVAYAVREYTLRARFPDSSAPISGSVLGEDKQ